jgi:hypothetical protein
MSILLENCEHYINEECWDTEVAVLKTLQL